MTSAILSVDEKIELSHLEERIERGLKSFFEAGQALTLINTKRLYRAEYDTFEEYCFERWDFDRTRAYQLMSAAKTFESLSKIFDKEALPANDFQTRQLSRLPADEQAEAWQEVRDRSNDKPTGKTVQAVVAERKQRKLEPQQQAIVTEPEHPLFGETVTISRIRGDEVTAQTSAGEQVLFTPELQAIDPIESLKQRSGSLEAMVRKLVAAIRAGTINALILEEADRLVGESSV